MRTSKELNICGVLCTLSVLGFCVSCLKKKRKAKHKTKLREEIKSSFFSRSSQLISNSAKQHTHTHSHSKYSGWGVARNCLLVRAELFVCLVVYKRQWVKGHASLFALLFVETMCSRLVFRKRQDRNEK